MMSWHLLLGGRWRALIGALAVVLLLAGCKQPLYSQLSEQEANEVYAALARVGIDVDKVPTGERVWGVEVDPADIPLAIDTLNRLGLPKSRYATLGELFRREGIVSTPTEERVRFLYGVSQELSQTLSTIDGVVAARVHLVIPQNDPLAAQARAASASVFIKHRPDVDLQPTLSSIKSLVLRSVEGLTHDTVYVSFFAAEGIAPSAGVQRAGLVESMAMRRLINRYQFPLLMLMLLGAAGFGLWSIRHRRLPALSGGAGSGREAARWSGVARGSQAGERAAPVRKVLRPAGSDAAAEPRPGPDA